MSIDMKEIAEDKLSGYAMSLETIVLSAPSMTVFRTGRMSDDTAAVRVRRVFGFSFINSGTVARLPAFPFR